MVSTPSILCWCAALLVAGAVGFLYGRETRT